MKKKKSLLKTLIASAVSCICAVATVGFVFAIAGTNTGVATKINITNVGVTGGIKAYTAGAQTNHYYNQNSTGSTTIDALTDGDKILFSNANTLSAWGISSVAFPNSASPTSVEFHFEITNDGANSMGVKLSGLNSIVTSSNIQATYTITGSSTDFNVSNQTLNDSLIGFNIASSQSASLVLSLAVDSSLQGVSLSGLTFNLAIKQESDIVRTVTLSDGTNTVQKSVVIGQKISEIPLPSSFTAPTGKELAGWSLTSGGTASSETVTSSTTTLYTVWQNINYAINYVLNTGSNSASNPSTYTYETATITLADPTKLGYTFDGWFETSDFSGTAVTEIPTGSTGTKTFYAEWTGITPTLTVPQSPTITAVYGYTAFVVGTYSASTVTTDTFTWSISNETNFEISSTGELTFKAGADANSYSTSVYATSSINGISGTSGQITVTITQKEVTLSWGDTNTWTYDGTEHSTTCTAGSLISGDTCTVNLSNNAITNAGTQTVTASSLSNANYKLPTSKTETLTITPKEVTLSWGDTNTWTYDGEAHSTTCTAGSLISGDTCTVNLSNNSIINAGYEVVTASTLSNTNYKLPTSNTTQTLTVNAKEVAVSWTNTSFTYDGTAKTPTATATGVSGETLNFTVTVSQKENGTALTSGNAVDAGTFGATGVLGSVTGGQANTGNYTLTNITTDFTINKATGSLSLSATSGSVILGNTITFTVTRVGDGAITVTSSDTTKATVSISGTTVTVTGVAEGTATITVSVAESTNYTAPSDATFSATVSAPDGIKNLGLTYGKLSGSSSGLNGYWYFEYNSVKWVIIGGADTTYKPSGVTTTDTAWTSTELSGNQVLVISEEILYLATWTSSASSYTAITSSALSSHISLPTSVTNKIVGKSLTTNAAGSSTGVANKPDSSASYFLLATTGYNTITGQNFCIENYLAAPSLKVAAPGSVTTRASSWWLRSGYCDSGNGAYHVDNGGSNTTASIGPGDYWDTMIGVRPCFVVNLT